MPFKWDENFAACGSQFHISVHTSVFSRQKHLSIPFTRDVNVNQSTAFWEAFALMVKKHSFTAEEILN
jgi:hypothetical protein